MSMPDVRKLETLRAQARSLPDEPGIYRFFSGTNKLLYIGKARSLRRRASSYFGRTDSASPRVRMMCARIARLEFTVTPTEGDALVLEHDQIKQLKPLYNVLFRDDKSYPYLRISSHAHPRISFHRGKPRDDCYGPFPSSWAVRESIRVLQRAFKLRTCADSMFNNRSRPCLLHQIGRCSAPCVGRVDVAQYAADVNAAQRFLRGRATEVSDELTARMEQAALAQDYEQAASLRDSINALAEIRHRSAVTGGAANADFIGLHTGEHGSAVRLTAVRDGHLVGEIDSFPENAEGVTADELLAAFVAQHYARQRPPERVVARCALHGGMLARLAGSAGGKFVTSPRGAERDRIELCERNAAAALARRSHDSAAACSRMARLAAKLNVARLERMECFDISHTMGEAAMAACTVCIAGKMDPSRYRRYRLRTAAGGDDCAGLRETLARRYRNARAEPSCLPDLVIVDGGTAQVGAAVRTLQELGAAQQAVLGIAKGAARRPGTETLITGEGEILELQPTDPAFLLLLQARDEAHRFALAGHRRRRDKSRRSSVLDTVEGIGPGRKKSLLGEFGGLGGLRNASVSDLARIRGVGEELARRIYQALRTT